MKAVFIDGPSLHHLGRVLGIAQFDLSALKKFLTESAGKEKRLAQPIFVTVTAVMGKGAAYAWSAAGFDVLETVSTGSIDDQELIKKIAALDSDKVSEVVLVSTDQDYLTVLRQKASQGLSVCWVGSLVKGGNNTPLMSTSLQPLLGSEFNFVDLEPYKGELMLMPKKMPPAPNPDAPTRHLRIELSGAIGPEERTAILRVLDRILTKNPRLRFKVEG